MRDEKGPADTDGPQLAERDQIIDFRTSYPEGVCRLGRAERESFVRVLLRHNSSLANGCLSVLRQNSGEKGAILFY